jgi:hypothetical protein
MMKGLVLLLAHIFRAFSASLESIPASVINQFRMKFFVTSSILCFYMASSAHAFVLSPKPSSSTRVTQLQVQTSDKLAIEKEKLFKLIGKKSSTDSVLADPITKEAIQISAPGVVIGGDSRRSVQYKVQSPSNKFQGSSSTFIDLLEPVAEEGSESITTSTSPFTDLLRRAAPYVPVPLRQPIASLTDGEYIPMVSDVLVVSVCKVR